MKKQFAISLLFIVFAAVSYSSPPVGIAKDVGPNDRTHQQDLNIMVLPLTATVIDQGISAVFMPVKPEGHICFMAPFMAAGIAAIHQNTSTMVDRTIRMRFYGVYSNNKIIKTKGASKTTLHIDPGLRGC